MASEVQPEPTIVAPRNSIELKLVQIWEKLLQTSPISVHDDFFKLGGDSISAMSLLALVAQETGCPLPAGGVFQAPTIAEMAVLLGAGADPSLWSAMVPIQPHGTRPPLFCIHPGGGNVLCYLRLSNFLGNDQPFFGLQAPGVDGIRQPLNTVDAMAREYFEAIRQVQPHGPYYLAGWSAGGVIAYDLAQKMLAAGEQVAHLAIIDSGVLYTMGILKAMATDNGPGLFELLGREPRQNIAEFRRRSATAKIIPDEADDEMAIRIMQLFESNARAVCYYSPRPYPGRLDLYQAAEQLVPSRRQPYSEWSQQCSDIRLHIVPGNHLTVVHEPNVQALAIELERAMHTNG
jgi:thioesterase domain-containing protein/aryl carrier-like protein